jgi:3-oxoacyl-[acyl-carrier protein] reductase
MVSSAAAYPAPARQAAYVAIKAGLQGAARVTEKEVARQSVTVNIVRPGATDTDTPRSSTSRAAIDAMSTADALRRLARRKDIPRIVAWLASVDSHRISGATIDATRALW